jgi:shikimate kinase
MKALYKHKSGDIFAIETDDKGKVLSTSGPLLSKDLNPKMLDYDDYWNTEIKAKIKDFVRISKDEYLEILRKNGFVIQTIQKHLF